MDLGQLRPFNPITIKENSNQRVPTLNCNERSFVRLPVQSTPIIPPHAQKLNSSMREPQKGHCPILL
jgi:hypothetical protein